MLKNIISALVSIYNKTHKDYQLSLSTYYTEDNQFFIDMIKTIEDDEIII